MCILSEVGSSLVEATFRPSVQEMKQGESKGDNNKREGRSELVCV